MGWLVLGLLYVSQVARRTSTQDGLIGAQFIVCKPGSKQNSTQDGLIGAWIVVCEPGSMDNTHLGWADWCSAYCM